MKHTLIGLAVLILVASYATLTTPTPVSATTIAIVADVSGGHQSAREMAVPAISKFLTDKKGAQVVSSSLGADYTVKVKVELRDKYTWHVDGRHSNGRCILQTRIVDANGRTVYETTADRNVSDKSALNTALKLGVAGTSGMIAGARWFPGVYSHQTLRAIAYPLVVVPFCISGHREPLEKLAVQAAIEDAFASWQPQPK